MATTMMMKMATFVLFAMLSAGVATGTPSSALDDVDFAQSMIVGGSQSQIGDYPYFVEMGGCGGALVAPDIVLFAAHCQDWKDKQLIIGSYRSETLEEGAQERFCDTWIADPTYGTGGSDVNNDFALCKLNEPVQVSQSFVTLELNEEDSIPTDGTDLIVMGHGTLASGSVGPDYIHNVTVPIISNDVCNGPNMYDGSITDIMFCAGFASGGKDSCQGDSGGPIVKRTYQGDGTFVDTHVGVVSWGFGCALPNFPGVYARTSKRVGWIKETMCNRLDSVASFCNNNPTPTPSCSTGQDLTIKLTTDQYARETAWTLKDPNNQDVMIRQYLVNSHLNEHSICLESNKCYNWEVTDSYIPPDGFAGTYKFVLNGNEIISKTGDFAQSRTEQICTGDPVTSPTNAPVPSPTDAPVPSPTDVLPSPIKPPVSFPTNLPVPSPTNAPVASPVPQPPTDDTCGGNANIQFQLELQTDIYGEDTSWILGQLKENSNEVVSIDYRGDDYQSGTMLVLPSANAFYCLEEDRCYDFEITDAFGDGMLTGGYYKGYVAGVEEFYGDGEFSVRSHIFCTDNPVGTSDPTYINNFSSTLDPETTESPTSSPTEPPTRSPTKSPTASPTSATSFTTSPGCSDDPSFRFKNSRKKTCAKWVAKGKNKKIKKKCKRKWKKRRVYEYCPETCRLVGLGSCSP